MRDPARIPIILAALERRWQNVPDMRLGQLLVALLRQHRQVPHHREGPALFNVEDGLLLRWLGPQTEAERRYVHEEPRQAREGWHEWREEHGEREEPIAVDTNHRELLHAIKSHLDDIGALAAEFERVEEDAVYRYYHQSLKLYGLQNMIKRAQQLFQLLAPEGTELNEWFLAICRGGCEFQFDPGRSNSNWQMETRPILEAFWHCDYFVRQFGRYGRELDQPPMPMPSGWAAVLYLYGLR